MDLLKEVCIVDKYYLNNRPLCCCIYSDGFIDLKKYPKDPISRKSIEQEIDTIISMKKFVIYYDPYGVMNFPKKYINLYDVLFKYKNFLKINNVLIKDIPSPSLSSIFWELYSTKIPIFEERNTQKTPPDEIIISHFKKYVEAILILLKELEKQCKSWEKYLTEEQVEKGLHLFYPISWYVSTVLKNNNISIQKKQISIPPKNYGGFVMTPTREYITEGEGDIYILDWSSMYPQIIIGLNAFEQIGEGKVIDNFLKIYGDYSKINSSANKLLSDLYIQKENGDSTAKIILNSIYGLLASPKSKYYNPVAAADITLIGRFITTSIIQFLHKKGYSVFYSDTDSYFILDESRDKNKLKKIILFLEEWFSYLFNYKIKPKLKCSNKIKQIRFLEDKKGKLLKKIYLLEYCNGDKEIKGLSTKLISPINKKIINKYFDKIIQLGGLPKTIIKKEYSEASIIDFAKPVFIEESSEELSFGTHMLIFTKKGIKLDEQFVKKIDEVKDISEVDLNYYYNEIHSFILPYDNLLGFL